VHSIIDSFSLFYILGYAHCKHIANALQKRSAAVCAALDQYNAAAKVLQPPHSTLKWEDVVEYTFLSDFNLLCDTRQDIHTRPWATPLGRFALDTHFNIVHAREELKRLNLEVRRVATHIQDEDTFLHVREDTICTTNPHLAHQISLYCKVRGHFNAHHIHRIRQIAGLPGYTGTTSVDVALEARSSGTESAAEHNPDDERRENDADVVTQEQRELQGEQELEEQEEKVDNDLLAILTVTADPSKAGDWVESFVCIKYW
jgi:hypothetical protein